MSPQVYYNDNEPFVCAWLRNLIQAGHLPAGDVDERPIQEVSPDDLKGYTQAHFFAGIGGWAYALQLAGWGDRPVWTGSCPCQPFSAAGKRGSHTDERHLWPAWYDLIRECHPDTIFGEQVSGAAGLGWLDAVALDLETADYAIGACVLGAHSVGAPHLRQRLYFVGESTDGGCGTRGAGEAIPGAQARSAAERSVALGVMDDPAVTRRQGCESELLASRQTERRLPTGPGDARSLADAENGGKGAAVGGGRPLQESHDGRPWSDAEWLPCRDGKSRPTQPGLFPLAHGVPARVGRLRAYGNAIVPQVAAAFIEAFLACAP